MHYPTAWEHTDDLTKDGTKMNSVPAAWMLCNNVVTWIDVLSTFVEVEMCSQNMEGEQKSYFEDCKNVAFCKHQEKGKHSFTPQLSWSQMRFDRQCQAKSALSEQLWECPQIIFVSNRAVSVFSYLLLYESKISKLKQKKAKIICLLMVAGHMTYANMAFSKMQSASFPFASLQWGTESFLEFFHWHIQLFAHTVERFSSDWNSEKKNTLNRKLCKMKQKETNWTFLDSKVIPLCIIVWHVHFNLCACAKKAEVP